MDMRRALKDRLANYKVPQDLKIVETIPRNAMGKSELFPNICAFYYHGCRELPGEDLG